MTTPPRTLKDIPGWFRWADQELFKYFLSAGAPEEPGDLVELGVYMGKSAVLMGGCLRAGERFVVCDLFESEAADEANLQENSASYSSLSRRAFEDNYRALCGDLPEIVHGPSSTIVDHVPAASARFVHVDASHLYEHVAVDVDSAEMMLRKDGIVVFDDYRSEHTPGVAAAVWGAVQEGRLKPICVSPSKLYGAFGDPEGPRQRLQEWLVSFGRLRWQEQRIHGMDVLRVWPPKPPAAVADPEVAKQLRQVNRKLGRIEAALGIPGGAGRASLRSRVARIVRR
jgi:hypothetical protein